MSTDTRQTQPAGPAANPAQEEFLSLHDIAAIIMRRRWPIAIAVLLITLAAGVFFVTRPPEYQAEGYLQVIPPVSKDERVDKDLYETMTVSHLQQVSSGFLAQNVSVALQAEGLQIKPLELVKKVKITRPPKTDLIRLIAAAPAPDQALLIVRQWMCQYLDSMRKSNIRAELSRIYSLLKETQSELMEKQAAADQLKAREAQTVPLVTLSRAVDDRQLWSDFAVKAAPDPAALKKLSEIHIKGQEQSSEYISMKIALINAEQSLSSVQAKRDFYREVARMLTARMNGNGTVKDTPVKAGDNSLMSEAELYVNALINSSDIVQFGEPGLIAAGRGAIRKTAIVFLVALALTSICAFMCEWGKGLLSGR